MSAVYQMNLDPIPFNLLKAGKKKVEMRINKKGRDGIKPGDFIVFNHTQNGEQLNAKVISVSKFSSFAELYAAFPKEMLGYEKDEKADPDDMLTYYEKEEILANGVLAIEVEISQN